MTPPTPSIAHAATAADWNLLRSDPGAATVWYSLARSYTSRTLPWHADYVLRQAQRCAKTMGTTLPPLPPVDIPEQWRGGAEQLSLSAPWQKLAQVLNSLEYQLESDPGDWLSWLYYARCVEMDAQHDSESQAKSLHDAIRNALDLEPIKGESAHLLAQWRLRGGDPSSALNALRAVLLQAPQRHGSWLLQAQAQMQLGLERQARESFERAGQSRNPELLGLLAEKLYAFNFVQEALGVCEAVVQLDSENPRAWVALASLQGKLWKGAEALKSVDFALSLDPENQAAKRLREDLEAEGDCQKQFQADLRRFQQEGPESNVRGGARLLMQSLYQSELSAIEVADIHRRVGKAMEDEARNLLPRLEDAPHAEPWNSERRRLRVGYVSGDLHRQHPVNLFMLPILQRHDHQAFEIFIYQTGTFIDAYTRKAQACADHWREAAHLDDRLLAQLIRDDEIDILIDLAGHTATHRLGVFTARPAPVQMSYLGYPHSTGLSCIDWMIADHVVAPSGSEHLFTEKLARLSGCVFCWAPIDDYPLTEEPSKPRQGPIVFASFNNLLKMNEATLNAWGEILKKCPDSLLMLKSATLADPLVANQTRERFQSVGVSGDRLILRGPSELSEMMQEYLEVDVALDPFPYNGGTTSLQALWMGCPLVSLEGRNFVSRMGASFLHHMNRGEWLARSVEEYVEHALSLSSMVRNGSWHRQQLREAMLQTPVCQIEAHTRDLEALYLRVMGAGG